MNWLKRKYKAVMKNEVLFNFIASSVCFAAMVGVCADSLKAFFLCCSGLYLFMWFIALCIQIFTKNLPLIMINQNTGGDDNAD